MNGGDHASHESRGPFPVQQAWFNQPPPLHSSRMHPRKGRYPKAGIHSDMSHLGMWGLRLREFILEALNVAILTHLFHITSQRGGHYYQTLSGKKKLRHGESVT